MGTVDERTSFIAGINPNHPTCTAGPEPPVSFSAREKLVVKLMGPRRAGIAGPTTIVKLLGL